MKTFLIGLLEAALYHVGHRLPKSSKAADWAITTSLQLDQKYLGERRYKAAKQFIHGGS